MVDAKIPSAGKCNPPYLRPCVIVIENNKVLCIRLRYRNQEYFVFPGGGLEAHETLREAAAREVREEAGFDVEIGKLVYVQDLIRERATNDRAIDFYFLGTRVGSASYPTVTDGGKNLGAHWIPLDDFKNSDFLPAAIRVRLADDYRSGFLQTIFLESVLK